MVETLEKRIKINELPVGEVCDFTEFQCGDDEFALNYSIIAPDLEGFEYFAMRLNDSGDFTLSDYRSVIAKGGGVYYN